jgi:hypothetical protein
MMDVNDKRLRNVCTFTLDKLIAFHEIELLDMSHTHGFPLLKGQPSCQSTGQSGRLGGIKAADILYSLGFVSLRDVKFSELDLNNPVRPLGQGSLRDAL